MSYLQGNKGHEPWVRCFKCEVLRPIAQIIKVAGVDVCKDQEVCARMRANAR